MTEYLPVDDIRGEFDAVLSRNAPVIVTAPTGSGKSTRLPLWMDEELDGPILVVEPRRVACRSLAEWLSKQRGEQVGTTIGYTVRFDDRTTDATRVRFATTGVVLRMLDERSDFPYAGVLIDEFHERSWQVDLILALLRRRRERGEAFSLVLTSATLEAESLASELEAELLEASGRTYPVDVSYWGEPPAPSRRDLDEHVRDAVDQTLERDPDGDILVFLPGKGEIADCDAALNALSGAHDFETVPVHGGLQSHQMGRALDQSHTTRRVYLATNVAETSLTLPGVTTVIDSGLARMKIHRGGRSALALVPIARDSMDQRAGRAGRVQEGRCIRLWSRRFRPSEVTQPELERIELDDMMLHAGACGMSIEEFEQAPWVTTPPEFAAEQARERLIAVGAFSRDGELTEIGRRLAMLPVDGHDARMLIDASGALAAYACDLVALLQLNGRLVLGTGSRDAHRARAELAGSFDNEVHVQVAYLRGGDARRHKLHGGALDEARKTSSSLRDLLELERRDPTRDTLELPSTSEVAEFLLERVPEAGFVLRERALRRRNGGKPRPGRSEPWANGQVELSVWPYEPPRPEGEDPPDPPVAGLILDHFWLGDSGTSVRGTGNLVLPCTYDQLADAGLGDVEVGHTRLKGSNPPRVVAEIERVLAGVTIASREEALTGERLCEAVADFVMENRLLKGAGERVLDALHLWDVLAGWPEPERQWSDDAPPEPHAYLVERLRTLGLETADELILIEPDDLVPDLEEELEIMTYQLEQFADDFPRIWEHMGARYVCNVQASANKVILEPANKKASRGKDPSPQHVPRFRGFRVYYRNASRVVPIT
jgi:ATP-dependent helicase HrpB